MNEVNRVYDLLPAVHRMRDAQLGGPLRELLNVVNRQLRRLETDIDQLYDDLFVETCDSRLIGYFADLVGVPLGYAGAAGESTYATAARRLVVVNAIANRRAKGTLTAIEHIASDSTSWPVRAAEQGSRVSVTQSTNHPEPQRGRLLDLRDGDRLSELGTPFCTDAALPDVRRAGTHRSNPVGPHPNAVTLSLWRLGVEHVHYAPAAIIDDDHHYTFDALGRDLQLTVAPSQRRPGASPASDLDVPAAITRRRLARHLEDYYGVDRSLCVYRGHTPVPRQQVVVADLSRWEFDPEHIERRYADRAYLRRYDQRGSDQVAIDPETGRIAFPARYAPKAGVWVRYHHLGVGPLGGGSYHRRPTPPPSGAFVGQVANDGTRDHTTVMGAIGAWRAAARRGSSAVIEIMDSAVYAEVFDIQLRAGESLEIRAAAGHRPILRPVDDEYRPRRLRVAGGDKRATSNPPHLTLDGVWVAGHAMQLDGRFGRVTIRHCTLTPPSERGTERDQHPIALAITAMPCTVSITSSVIGRVRVSSPEVGYDPIPLTVAHSILDAGHADKDALGGPDDRAAYVELSLTRCTVLGRAHVHRTALIEDSILTGHLHSVQRQKGSVRFSCLPEGSHTPRRTQCQPDAVLAATADSVRRGEIGPDDTDARLRDAAQRVRPRFLSTRFGVPGYARLAEHAAIELRRGARDEGELGAHHDLWLARRVDDLRSGLQEFTPIGIGIDIVFS